LAFADTSLQGRFFSLQGTIILKKILGIVSAEKKAILRLLKDLELAYFKKGQLRSKHILNREKAMN